MKTHGLNGTYLTGCRCGDCRAAHTAAIARQRAARGQRSEDEVPHGLSGYDNWLCRCPVCSAAKQVQNARRYA